MGVGTSGVREERQALERLDATGIELSRRSKQYLTFRLLMVLLGCGLVAFYQVWLTPAQRRPASELLYGLIACYLGFALYAMAAFARHGHRPASLRRQVVGDFVFQSLLIWGTGGVFSLFSPLLFVTLAAATSLVSARATFVLATTVTVLLSAATVAAAVGFVPPGAVSVEWVFEGESSAIVVMYLLGSIAALYAVSALGSRLSHGLRRMQSLHGEILENMAQGLIAIDGDGSVLQLNKEARNLWPQVSRQAAARRPSVADLFPEEAHAAVRQAFTGDRRRRIRTEIGGGSEPRRPVEVRISAVPDETGTTRCRIGIVTDLSLQREVEAAERRIQKLQDLQIMALGLAHEIRNPLASIRGCVQEIRRCLPAGDRSAKYMEIVCRESDRLDGIIEQFLAFARSGPVDLAPLDLGEVLEESLVLLRARADWRGRTVNMTMPDDHPWIFGDRDRLVQVFLNLGLNAIQATEESAGRIVVTVASRAFAAVGDARDDDDFIDGVEVSFQDNGVGMSESDMQRLFTPFHTTKARGTGLGLCIVERIVREHRGVVDVASQQGLGTVFRLWFPLLRSRGGAGRPAAQEASAPARDEEAVEGVTYA